MEGRWVGGWGNQGEGNGNKPPYLIQAKLPKLTSRINSFTGSKDRHKKNVVRTKMRSTNELSALSVLYYWYIHSSLFEIREVFNLY